MTPTEMEIRVAKAIATVWVEQNPPLMKQGQHGLNVDSQIRNFTKLFVPHARAAIQAMREPTQEMYEAVSATGLMWRNLCSEKVYQAMINAASPDRE